MKEQHVTALKTILSSENGEKNAALFNAIVGFLNEETAENQMTCEELIECCKTSKPIALPAAVIFELAKAYENNKIHRPFKAYTFELYSEAVRRGHHEARFDLGWCYFYGYGTSAEPDAAKKIFLGYITKAPKEKQEQYKADVAYYLGVIAIIDGNEDEAVGYLATVAEQPEANKQLATVLMQHLIEKNYTNLSEQLQKIGGDAFLKMFFANVLKKKNALAVQGAHKYSLQRMYPLVGQNRLTTESSSSSSASGKNKVSNSSAGTEEPSQSNTQSFWAKETMGDTPIHVYDRRGALLERDTSQKNRKRKREEGENAFGAAKTNFKKKKLEVDDWEEKLESAQYNGESVHHLQLLAQFRDIEKVEFEEAKTQLQGVKPAEITEEPEPSFPCVYDAATRKQLLNQYYAQQRFFDPKRTRKTKTFEIAATLQNQRLPTFTEDTNEEGKEDKASTEIKTVQMDFSGIPTRRLITAERSVVESAVQLRGTEDSTHPPQHNELGYAFGKKETVLVGSAPFSYTPYSAYPNHRGDYHGDDIGGYENIFQVLDGFTQTEESANKKQKEQHMATLLLRFAKTGTPVSIPEAKELKKNVTQEDVTRLNQIFYHVMVKENARRMVTKDARYDIPVAILQSRAIELIQAGFLSLKDVFSKDAAFGVVTGVKIFNNHHLVVKKMNRINQMYEDCILKPQLYTKNPTLLANRSGATVVSSCAGLRQELQKTYGAEDDTDGEGYSSSEEECGQLKARVFLKL